MSLLDLKDDEKQVFKNAFWIFLGIYLSWTALSIFFGSAALTYITPNLGPEVKKLLVGLPRSCAANFVDIILQILIIFSIAFFCNYRKPGTRFLTFLRFLTWIALINCTVKFLALLVVAPFIFQSEVKVMKFLTLFFSLNYLFCAAEIYFSFKYTKLIKGINQKRFMRIVESSTEYNDFKSKISQIRKLDDLKTLYSFYIQQYPEIERALTFDYKNRKKEILA